MSSRKILFSILTVIGITLFGLPSQAQNMPQPSNTSLSPPLLLQMAALASQIFTGLLAAGTFIWTVRSTAKTTKIIKKADVLMEVHRKFDELLKDYKNLDVNSNALDRKHYYSRFWSLQSQQFHYWCDEDLINDDFFIRGWYTDENNLRIKVSRMNGRS